MFLHLLSIGVAEVSAVVTFGKWRTLNRLLILQSHVLRYVIKKGCNVFLCNFQNSFHSVFNGCERFPNVLLGGLVSVRDMEIFEGVWSGFPKQTHAFCEGFRNISKYLL